MSKTRPLKKRNPVNEMKNYFAIVRIRGSMETRGKVEDALRINHLTRKNHCVILEDSPQLKGLLVHCRDFVTWGEIAPQTLEKMLLARGMLEGGKRLTNDYVAKNSTFKDITQFSKAILDGSAKMTSLKGLKPLFRLNSPSKGFESIKRHFPVGALGYRGDRINELILRML